MIVPAYAQLSTLLQGHCNQSAVVASQKKFSFIQACKINLEDLEQIDVCHGMMILIKTEMAAEMVVRCIVPILICGSDDDKQQLAATEWKNAVVNQIEKIKPVWGGFTMPVWGALQAWAQNS